MAKRKAVKKKATKTKSAATSSNVSFSFDFDKDKLQEKVAEAMKKKLHSLPEIVEQEVTDGLCRLDTEMSEMVTAAVQHEMAAIQKEIQAIVKRNAKNIAEYFVSGLSVEFDTYAADTLNIT